MVCPRRASAALVAVLFICVGIKASAQAPPLAPTPGTGMGPDYLPDAPANAQLWQPGDPGQRLHLRGRVLSTSGEPLAGALVELWQMDGAGSYHDDRYRARLQTGDKGEFAIATALPGAGFWARHIHVVVSHPSHQRLVSRILFKGDPNLSSGVDDALAIVLEEVRDKDETVLFGGVELVLRPAAGG